MNISKLLNNATMVCDLAIPLRFNGEQPNVYGVENASSKPCEYGELVGDTRRGGSVNFENYAFIPHCNGTHTECVGHITEERIFVLDCLKDAFSEAVLISIEPENAIESGESYPYEIEKTDLFISKQRLEKALHDRNRSPLTAHRSPETAPRSLIIRTLPNDESKLTRKYDKPVPPFFSNDAIAFVVDSGFKHLLVDIPSIDRLYDDGKLSNHRIFWNVPPRVKSVDKNTRLESTVTELIYVPPQITDGDYILNLQVAPFDSDAAPSRPVLFNRT